jgi:hypothetical protein
MHTTNGESITTREAAAIIGCSEAHVRWLASRGHIDAQDFSGVWAIDRDSVERFAKTPQKIGRPRGK